MRRNALIYAMAEAAVIVHARFGEGGTWNGAIEARRRKICPLIVRNDGTPAARALIALGACPIERPDDLRVALESPEAQGRFFA